MDKSYIEISNIDAHWKESLKGIFSSSRINFLFGAGVNGSAFPGMNSYKETKEKIKGYLSNYHEELDIESNLDMIDQEQDREEAINTFINEYNEKYRQFSDKYMGDRNLDSIINFKKLLENTIRIIEDRETRNDNIYRKVNIFTLNYDEILEFCLEEIGQSYIKVYPSNTRSIQNFDLINYNNERRTFQASISIAKLHGTLTDGILKKENIVHPGREKFRTLLQEGYFELLFKFKNELLKQNSLLIIIGYSGNDMHINQFIKEGITKGLSVMYFKYSNEKNDNQSNKLLSENDNILIIDPVKVDSEYQDSTKNFCQLLSNLDLKYDNRENCKS